MNNLTQLAVRCNETTFSVLESKGYKNAQNLSIDNYTFPIIIADLKDKIFFGTNTTCMAAVCSCGICPKIFTLEEIIDIL